MDLWHLRYRNKEETPLAEKIYGADGVEFDDSAKKQLAQITELGFGSFPVCMAKTQFSFSDNPESFFY